MVGKSKSLGVQVIARAAAVLRALEGESNGLSLAQIAERVGLPRSTVQRIVDALREEHLLISAGPAAGVRLGPALVRLAASVGADFEQITRPIMVRLSQQLGETVDLSVRKGASAVFISQISGEHRLRAVSAVGEAFPLHCTANGKALLSLLTPPELQRALDGQLKKWTPNTLIRPRDLLQDVELSRRQGYASDLEEHTEGICAVGTAFYDPLGRSLALSIPVPTTRYKRMRAELVKHLLDAKSLINSSFQPGRLERK